MRKSLLVPLVIFAVAAVMVIMATTSKHKPVPRVEIRFLEFTNAPDGPAAVLAADYRPRFRSCHWTEFTTSRRVNGVWESWSPGKPRAEHKFVDVPNPPVMGRDGQRIGCLLVLPVENTNDAWRFVQQIQERQPMPPALVLRVSAWWHRFRGTVPPREEAELLPAYRITNETSQATIR